jgi:hypothetical protein
MVLGCGAGVRHVFHVVETRAAWVERAPQVPIAAADERDEQRVAAELAAALPGRVLVVRPADDYAMAVELEVARTVMGFAEPGSSATMSGGPDGTAYTSSPQPRRVSVAYEVTLSAHWLRAPIRASAREEGEDRALTEERAIHGVVRELVRELTRTDERHDLEVWEVRDAPADSAIRRAVEFRSADRCEAIARAAERLAGEQQGRAFFAAGRCEEALAIDASNRGGLDAAGLERALRWLEQARASWHDDIVEAAIREVQRLREERP